MRYYLLTALTALFIFSACGGDTAITENATVTGGWKLKRALRNNMETETLNGLYFEFQPDGTLVSNIMSPEEAKTGTYVWEGDQITTEGVALPLTYSVTELTDSTLYLKSKYQGYQFNFELIRDNNKALIN